MRPLGAHYVPTMCLKRVGVNRWAYNAPNVRPLQPFGAQPMRPLCTHYYALNVYFNFLDFNRWAHSVPTMRPLCAHYVPSIYVLKPPRGFKRWAPTAYIYLRPP
jgi:hypothetical protein